MAIWLSTLKASIKLNIFGCFQTQGKRQDLVDNLIVWVYISTAQYLEQANPIIPHNVSLVRLKVQINFQIRKNSLYCKQINNIIVCNLSPKIGNLITKTKQNETKKKKKKKKVISYIYKWSSHNSHIIKGNCTPNQKLACFVLYIVSQKYQHLFEE